jgi:hypothetical protein
MADVYLPEPLAAQSCRFLRDLQQILDLLSRLVFVLGCDIVDSMLTTHGRSSVDSLSMTEELPQRVPSASVLGGR